MSSPEARPGGAWNCGCGRVGRAIGNQLEPLLAGPDVSPDNRERFRADLDDLGEIVQPALHGLIALIGAETRWPLVPSEYRLYVPTWQGGLKVGDAIDALILEVEKHPGSIHSLTGRQFELFLRRLFEGFGYEVQLTAASRDGGVDLVCLIHTSGDIPVKIAIEAKRYGPDRPVTVSLIRQFVGANKLLKANKLVYVTTSRYTSSAKSYAAAPELVGLLELKGYEDVMRWASQFNEMQYTVGV